MLVVDVQEKDLGNLKFGKPHNFNYIITNSGDTIITVTKLLLGCQSCTTASISKQVIGVGQSSSIDVTFTPGSTGIQNKSLIVQYTDSFTQDQLSLKFKAIVAK